MSGSVRKNEKTGEEKWVCLVTMSKEIDPKILWKMMHKRSEIAENAFHQLKTYYHADHCYCHETVEVIFLQDDLRAEDVCWILYRRRIEIPKIE